MIFSALFGQFIDLGATLMVMEIQGWKVSDKVKSFPGNLSELNLDPK